MSTTSRLDSLSVLAILDCFWAGLPVVCTVGDTLADEIERDDLGETVPQRDPEAVAAAILRVLRNGKPSYAERIARAAERYRWSRVAEPLVRQLAIPASADAGAPFRAVGPRTPCERPGTRRREPY